MAGTPTSSSARPPTGEGTSGRGSAGTGGPSRVPAAAGRPTPVLVPQDVLAGQPAVPLDRSVTTVGSSDTCRLTLTSRTISRSHAVFLVDDGQTFVADLASRTGVLVNGRLVREAELKTGDKVQIGKFAFRYRPADAAPPAVPHGPAPAAAAVVAGLLAVPLAGRVAMIGRRETSDVALVGDSAVSAAHAALFHAGGQWYVRDLGSRTGTTVNGQPVVQQPVHFGDRIGVGAATIQFEPAVAVPGHATVTPDLAPPRPTDAAAFDAGLDDLMAADNLTLAGTSPIALAGDAAPGDAGESVADSAASPSASPPDLDGSVSLPLEPGLATDTHEPDESADFHELVQHEVVQRASVDQFEPESLATDQGPSADPAFDAAFAGAEPVDDDLTTTAPPPEVEPAGTFALTAGDPGEGDDRSAVGFAAAGAVPDFEPPSTLTAAEPLTTVPALADPDAVAAPDLVATAVEPPETDTPDSPFTGDVAVAELEPVPLADGSAGPPATPEALSESWDAAAVADAVPRNRQTADVAEPDADDVPPLTSADRAPAAAAAAETAIAAPTVVPSSPVPPPGLLDDVSDFVFVPGEADPSAGADVLFWGDPDLDAATEATVATAAGPAATALPPGDGVDTLPDLSAEREFEPEFSAAEAGVSGAHPLPVAADSQPTTESAPESAPDAAGQSEPVFAPIATADVAAGEPVEPEPVEPEQVYALFPPDGPLVEGADTPLQPLAAAGTADDTLDASAADPAPADVGLPDAFFAPGEPGAIADLTDAPAAADPFAPEGLDPALAVTPADHAADAGADAAMAEPDAPSEPTMAVEPIAFDDQLANALPVEAAAPDPFSAALAAGFTEGGLDESALDWFEDAAPSDAGVEPVSLTAVTPASVDPFAAVIAADLPPEEPTGFDPDPDPADVAVSPVTDSTFVYQAGDEADVDSQDHGPAGPGAGPGHVAGGAADLLPSAADDDVTDGGRQTSADGFTATAPESLDESPAGFDLEPVGDHAADFADLELLDVGSPAVLPPLAAGVVGAVVNVGGSLSAGAVGVTTALAALDVSARPDPVTGAVVDPVAGLTEPPTGVGAMAGSPPDDGDDRALLDFETDARPPGPVPQSPPLAEAVVVPDPSAPLDPPARVEVVTEAPTEPPAAVTPSAGGIVQAAEPAPATGAVPPRMSGPSLFGFNFDGGSFLGGMPLPLNGPVATLPPGGIVFDTPVLGQPADTTTATPVPAAESAAVVDVPPPAAELSTTVSGDVPPAVPVIPPTRVRPVAPQPLGLTGLVTGTADQPAAAPMLPTAVPPPPIPPVGMVGGNGSARSGANGSASGAGNGSANGEAAGPGAGRSASPAPRPTASMMAATTNGRPRTAEVFSQMAGPIGVEAFATRPGRPDQHQIPDVVRDDAAVRGGPAGGAVGGRLDPALDYAAAGMAPPPAYRVPNEARLIPADMRRKTKVRLLLTLTVLIPALIVAGVYAYMSKTATVVGTIRYDGLATQGASTQRLFKGDQVARLCGDEVRNMARARLLADQKPTGPTEDSIAMGQAIQDDQIKRKWEGNQLQLTYTATDGNTGKAQLEALMSALRVKDEPLSDDRARKARALDVATDALRTAKDEDESLKAQFRRQTDLGEQRPDKATVDALDKSSDDATARLAGVRSGRTATESVLADLQKQDPSKPVDVNADPQVVGLRKQRQVLQDQIAKGRRLNAMGGGTAEAKGDDPVATLQQQQVDQLSAQLDRRLAQLGRDAAVPPEQRARERETAIESLTGKLAGLRNAEVDAVAAASTAATAAADAHAKVDAARSAYARAEEIRGQLVDADSKLRDASDDQGQKQRDLDACVTVAGSASTNPDVLVPPGGETDPRPLVAAVGGGLAFVGLGFWALVVAGSGEDDDGGPGSHGVDGDDEDFSDEPAGDRPTYAAADPRQPAGV